MARPHVNPFQSRRAVGSVNEVETKTKRVWHTRTIPRLLSFTYITLVTCFPALEIGYSVSPVWQWLQVFPFVTLAACFPAPGTSYSFSPVWHWSHVFSRLVLVSCVPRLASVTFLVYLLVFLPGDIRISMLLLTSSVN